ncbi:MAG TPA: hypothetical protein HPP77_02095 [Candidatus Hydrogenedentes bacterium]|nr:hypothetical protein [Candidatus Hydrogenedentota bacterium]
MKALGIEELKTFLESLSDTYDVRAPIELKDGTRTLGRLEEGPLALFGGRTPRKPTDVFFPQFDRVLAAFPDGRVELAPAPQKPIFVVGFTAEDLDCLEFIDKFFSTNFRDHPYYSKRDTAVIVGLSGRCGEAGAFMKIAGGKCDIELIWDGTDFIVAAYSETGNDLVASMDCPTIDAPLDALQRESDALPSEERDILLKASDLIVNGKVPEAFWTEIGDRCIACTSCNLTCPTCTCFDVQDYDYEGGVERSRIWDSCQFDGFMREASGHSPLGTETLRTRRRIHHRLAADRERWGHITCFLCGRCDDACPTGIGIKAVSKEIVARFS